MARTSDKARNERIIALRDEGLTYDAIAAELGITRNMVSGVLKRAGKTDPNNYRSHNTSRERVSSAHKAMVVEAYCNGMTGKEAAAEFGFHPCTMSVWRREMGFKPKAVLKLTDADVAEIRAMRAAGHKLKNIAERFGVHMTHICKITLGQSRA